MATAVVVSMAGLVGCSSNADSPPVPGSGDTFEQGGPLLVPPDNVYYPDYEQGDVFTDGWQRLLVKGDERAVVESVELTGSNGLELVDVLYAGADRKIGSVQVMPRFPPRRRALGQLMPVEGATVPPGDMGLELIIGLRVTGDGFAFREGVRIRYRVGQTRYVVDFPSGIAVCPPRTPFEACEEQWNQVNS